MLTVDQRLQLEFDANRRRRWIAGRETIIHCHHYNSRIQNTIEAATAIDGKGIFVSSSEAVFGKLLADNFGLEESNSEKWQFATDLYSHLGFGKLDVSQVEAGQVVASSSHFAEGWLAGFPSRQEPVCSLTEGYLQGAIAAVTGEVVYVKEVECQIQGAERCRFEIHDDRKEPLCTYEKKQIEEEAAIDLASTLNSTTVDEKTIVAALSDMPILGNEEGLIPAFNVYLASTPADFYNLVAIRFVEAMETQQLGDVARMQLIHAAETCGLNTFRGIRDSAEWDALIAPMVHSKEDELFGIIAVSNGLGWGNWHVTDLVPGKSLQLRTCNGYESTGFRQLRGKSQEPSCPMLTGVAAGIFELVYVEGSIEERFGQCDSRETKCLCQGDDFCEIQVTML